MTDALKIQLIQSDLQKLAASLTISNHFTQYDHKCLQFLFYAEYDIIYQTFEMKHAAYLQKKLVNKSKRQQSQQIQRKYQVLSQRNHQKIVKYDSSVDRILNRLQFEWNHKNIPYFHRYYFQKYIENDLKHYIQSLEKLILNEQKMIKSDIHIIYSLDRAINARQICLTQYKRFLSTLKQSDIQDYLYTCTQRLYYLRSRKQKIQYQIQGYKINKITDKKVSKNIFELTQFQLFGQLHHHFIKLTLHVIQLISKWKDYIYSLTSDPLKRKQQVDYYYQEQNYLLRIINDNSFVSKSFLANYFKFSPKNDPFLLMPLLNIQKDQRNITENVNSSQSDIQQSTQLKCLKKILAPQSQAQILQILSKLRLLVNQFQNNIKNRKIFDLRIIHKINNLDYTPSIKNLSKSSVKQQSVIDSQQSLGKSSVSLNKSRSFKITKLSPMNSYKNLTTQTNSPILKQKNSSIQKNPLLKLSQPNESTLAPKGIKQINQLNQNPQKNQKNKLSTSIGLKLMDSQQLLIIKQELKQKIKSQLKLNDNKTSNLIFQKPQLADYIESQVKKVFLQTKFQQQFYTNNQSKNPLRQTGFRNKLMNKMFIQTYSIEQSQLPSHLQYFFEHQTLLQYEFMQLTKQEILNGKDQHADKHDMLQNLPCLYFLKVKQKNLQKRQLLSKSQKQNIISNIMFTIKYMKKQSLANKKHQKVQRVIQILYMTIKSSKAFQLQKVILKTVQFLFKYQTANSIIFSFYYNQQVENQKQKLKQLKSILQISNCMIGQKYIYKKIKKDNKKKLKIKDLNVIDKQKITQVKFHFTRKDDHKISISNLNYPNQSLQQSPLSLYIGLYGLLSNQKLNMVNGLNQKQSEQILTQINYDYLLTQIIKNHLNSDYFLTLRNKSLWQHRLRVIIQNILTLKQKQTNQQTLPFLEVQQFQNISQLNKARNYQQKSLWTGVDDLFKSNIIKMFSLNLKLSLPYLCQAYINSKGTPYFRFQVREQIQVLNMSYTSSFKLKNVQNQIYEQKIYLFSCLQKKNIKIGLFDATQVHKFIKKQNQKLVQSGQKTSIFTISDLLNGISFLKTQNYGRSMRFISKQKQYIRNLFIPMFKRSTNTKKQNNNKHEQNTINPIKSKELRSIQQNQSNQLIIGNNLQWNYNVYLQNGIRFNVQKQKSDILLQSSQISQQKQDKRMGIVLYLIPQYVVIYARVI